MSYAHEQMQAQPQFEIVVFRDLGDGDLQVQLAVEGKLAPMVDDHKSSMANFTCDWDYFKDMARKCETLIHLYGDARYPLPVEETMIRAERGF